MPYRIYASRYRSFILDGLRISLGLIFFWFGALKIFGYNPVLEIVAATFPFFATAGGSILLGILESLIGVGLLANVVPQIVHWALLLHLAGTFTAFSLAPELMFDPYFPVLTLAGEFVFKNATLVMAGLVILAYRKR